MGVLCYLYTEYLCGNVFIAYAKRRKDSEVHPCCIGYDEFRHKDKLIRTSHHTIDSKFINHHCKTTKGSDDGLYGLTSPLPKLFILYITQIAVKSVYHFSGKPPAVVVFIKLMTISIQNVPKYIRFV